MIGYIYCITCDKTNKVYIGQVTHEYHRRFNRHLRIAFTTKKRIRNCKFYRAVRKYGKESFSVKCLEQKPFDNITECVNWLDEREKYWISYYDSYLNGYNSTTGGHQGYEFTEEIRYKMGSGNRGKKLSAEEIEKRISPLRGRKQSKEEIENRSRSLRGKKRTSEQRKHISDATKGCVAYNRKPVYQYKDGVLTATYVSLKNAAQETSIGIGRINRCCLGQIKSVDDFEFTYKLK